MIDKDLLKRAKEEKKRRIAELCPDWRNVVLSSGKHKGKTVEWVYVNDQNALFLAVIHPTTISAEEQKAIVAALIWKDIVDPMYDDQQLNDIRRGR